MDLKIKNKLALIVGASGSIGSKVSIDLANEGTKVILLGRSLQKLNNLKKLMLNKNRHEIMQFDLEKQPELTNFKNQIKKLNSYPDIIVHCLGGSLGIVNPLSNKEDWIKVWNINLGIAHEINRLIIPKMKKKKWGRVVHISSLATSFMKGNPPYISAKYALEGYVKRMSKEYSKNNIIINAISPGLIDIKKRYFSNLKKNNYKQFKSFLDHHIDIKRLSNLKEISQVIVFLCSEHSSYMPGSIVKVDGQGN